ncbi:MULTISPECIES: rhodanese-like domain-containing protein [Actinomycetes]|uniref:Rhodanese-like domain-containing protein n=2 Tax=Actinomycetes TaxID=1760 RepID=A0ABP6LZN4_9MICC
MADQNTLTLLSAEELRRMIADGADPLLIDVRTSPEHRSAHLPGSLLVPDELVSRETQRLADALVAVDRPVVLLCQAGPRSQQAQEALTAAGLTDSRVLAGGLNAYRATVGDDAVEIGEGPWAMERQVRMAAGSLVLVGLLGGRLLSPKARVVSGAIASGLVFSAATNTCGMAKVLAQMPWNQSPQGPVRIEDVLQEIQAVSAPA